jgi:rubrerythrin
VTDITQAAERLRIDELELLLKRKNAAIEYLQQKKLDDIAAIRAAMQLARDTFDRYAKIADPVDEATLKGMQTIIDVYEAEVRLCQFR